MDRLAQSIAEVGLRTPISLYQQGDKAILVAGLHRLRACEKLGWDMIPAIFMDSDTAIDRERWEIAENLHRADLTVLQRSEHIARWVALTNEKAQLAPFSKRGAGRGNKGGVNAAVAELGIDRTEAQRAVKAASITDEAKEAARAAGLDDNQSALLEVARAEPDQQVAKVEEVRQRREARQGATRLSVPRDPIKAAEALCKAFTVDELAKVIAVLMKARQSDEG